MREAAVVAIRTLERREVEPLAEEIVDVYREAFAAPPNDEDEASVQEFAGRFPPHLHRDGFRFVGAFDDGGSLVGFAYGQSGSDRYWWHRTVAAAMPPAEVERWLADYFHVLELAVRPAWQGRGVGGALHDALLEDLPHPTAALSTRDVDYVATRMYASRGWVPLLRRFRFGEGQPEFMVMGRTLARSR